MFKRIFSANIAHQIHALVAPHQFSLPGIIIGKLR
jgi:hypothetical protein